MSVFKKILASGEGKKAKSLAALVPHINNQEAELKALSDDALKAKTVEFRERLEHGESLEDLLIEAFAVVREASWRVIGQRHFDVQLMGGAALHFGWVAEMKTGEGKTLVSTLPVYLNGLANKGVHVVTVNDYLAVRDSDWMGQIHRWLGLTVGLIVPDERNFAYKKEQYLADVTYGTNNELGFDYLRDNMVLEPDQQSQRGHEFCIVDEVDSILIDEARTPLIISGRLADAAKTYYQFAAITAGLTSNIHYEVDEEKRSVVPLDEGIAVVEKELGIDNLYDSIQVNYVHQLQAALRAKELYLRDRDYVVQNGEVKIVDEFTGRILDGRRWSEGLHQAVEAKEAVPIKEENQTLATVTLQNYFRLYNKLAGMTGTALTEANELHSTYGLEVVPIETNKPLMRKDEPDYIYRSEDVKYNALADDIQERNKLGQPILVGTVSVEKSEKLASILSKRGIAHEVLNAKQHFREAEIVAQAGRVGAITVATNMAGRGVDIVLGGNYEALAHRDLLAEGLDPESEEGTKRYSELLDRYESLCEAEGEEVRKLGGLYVLGTERHESRRIDNQLRGRSGRQGDPGESRFYLSLDDDLMRIFATGAMNWVMARSEDDMPIVSKVVTKAVERAQSTVEQKNAEIRKNVLKYDEVMNQQRKVIYARREQLLTGTDIKKETLGAIKSTIQTSVSDHLEGEAWNKPALLLDIANLWPTELGEDDLTGDKDEIIELLYQDACDYHQSKEEKFDEDNMRKLESHYMLRIIDQRWREHLYDMDYLREGINLRAIGQKDPLIEWQREAFEMFEEMLKAAASEFVTYLMHSEIVQESGAGESEQPDSPKAEKADATGVALNIAVAEEDKAGSSKNKEPALAGVTASKPVQTLQGKALEEKIITENPAPVKTITKTQEERVGRNSPCHCGSGRKFKFCHGR